MTQSRPRRRRLTGSAGSTRTMVSTRSACSTAAIIEILQISELLPELVVRAGRRSSTLELSGQLFDGHVGIRSELAEAVLEVPLSLSSHDLAHARKHQSIWIPPGRSCRCPRSIDSTDEVI